MLTREEASNREDTSLVFVGYQVLQSLKGNPVQFGNGPAAVNGDEIRLSHCLAQAGGKAPGSRLIRESEDLPDGVVEPVRGHTG